MSRNIAHPSWPCRVARASHVEGPGATAPACDLGVNTSGSDFNVISVSRTYVHVECACVRGRVIPGLGAFQPQLVPGLSLGIYMGHSRSSWVRGVPYSISVHLDSGRGRRVAEWRCVYRRLRPVHTTGVPGRSPCVRVWAARAGIGYLVREACYSPRAWRLANVSLLRLTLRPGPRSHHRRLRCRLGPIMRDFDRPLCPDKQGRNDACACLFVLRLSCIRHTRLVANWSAAHWVD